jgi:hypothetical protein
VRYRYQYRKRHTASSRAVPCLLQSARSRYATWASGHDCGQYEKPVASCGQLRAQRVAIELLAADVRRPE